MRRCLLLALAALLALAGCTTTVAGGASPAGASPTAPAGVSPGTPPCHRTTYAEPKEGTVTAPGMAVSPAPGGGGIIGWLIEGDRFTTWSEITCGTDVQLEITAQLRPLPESAPRGPAIMGRVVANGSTTVG